MISISYRATPHDPEDLHFLIIVSYCAATLGRSYVPHVGCSTSTSHRGMKSIAGDTNRLFSWVAMRVM